MSLSRRADQRTSADHGLSRRALLALVIVSGVAVGACGDDGNDQRSTGPRIATTTVPSTGVTVEVLAIDNIFRNELVSVDVGDEVLWTNRGQNEHNILPVDGDDWGVGVVDFQPGDTYSYSFGSPGIYEYYCSIHGTEDVGMIGTIAVGG